MYPSSVTVGCTAVPPTAVAGKHAVPGLNEEAAQPAGKEGESQSHARLNWAMGRPHSITSWSLQFQQHEKLRTSESAAACTSRVPHPSTMQVLTKIRVPAQSNSVSYCSSSSRGGEQGQARDGSGPCRDALAVWVASCTQWPQHDF